MKNDEILYLWESSRITCGEVIAMARADEREKVFNWLATMFTACSNDGDYYSIEEVRAMFEERVA